MLSFRRRPESYPTWYEPERGGVFPTRYERAEFLLNNAVDAADYRKACEAVRAMGLEPEAVVHKPPAK